jgi:hypothetical protein
VLHHYQLVVDRYLLTTRGKQSFRAFIPQEALPGVINVEEIAPRTENTGGQTNQQRHVLVTTELARIDLWLDGDQRVERIAIAEASLEAIRKK